MQVIHFVWGFGCTLKGLQLSFVMALQSSNTLLPILQPFPTWPVVNHPGSFPVVGASPNSRIHFQGEDPKTSETVEAHRQELR